MVGLSASHVSFPGLGSHPFLLRHPAELYFLCQEAKELVLLEESGSTLLEKCVHLTFKHKNKS